MLGSARGPACCHRPLWPTLNFCFALKSVFSTRFQTKFILASRQNPHASRVRSPERLAPSFGAICGGEVTVLVEPQNLDEAIFLIGVGHCSKAIAKLCVECGLFVTVVDDRNELMKDLPENVSAVAQTTPAEFIRNREWQQDEALVIASRNYEIDRDALIAALAIQGIGYIGMIGSRRKVLPVFDQLKENGNQGRTPRAGLRPSRARHWRRFSGRNCGQRPG